VLPFYTQIVLPDLACKAGARVRDWTNALEDVRIEQKEIRAGAFPALGSLLSTMVNHLHYEAVIGAGKARSAPALPTRPMCPALGVANGYAVPAAGGLEDGLSPSGGDRGASWLVFVFAVRPKMLPAGRTAGSSRNRLTAASNPGRNPARIRARAPARCWKLWGVPDAGA
jgi:hypothetical protein